jgi:hypothetical protein
MSTAPGSSELPDEIHQTLLDRGVTTLDEVGLRVELERHLPAYTLYRLTPAAARRWKCRYRLMFGDTYLDCQNVAEAYARALLTIMPGS